MSPERPILRALQICLIFSLMQGCAGSSAASPETPGGSVPAAPSAPSGRSLPAEAEADLRILREAWPGEILGMERAPDGSLLLRMRDGSRVHYAAAPGTPQAGADVRASMAQAYPLEPARPDTPAGFAPGRVRSQALLAALCGDGRKAVEAGLRRTSFFGRPIRLAPPAAAALERVEARLRAVADDSLLPWLKAAGGFNWRRIAGEDRLSAHAFGLALDISPEKAAYWRWCPLRPHPLQKDYPAAIVAAFEAEGFIWGGKWHEYDLMHFEYRPELILKARAARGER